MFLASAVCKKELGKKGSPHANPDQVYFSSFTSFVSGPFSLCLYAKVTNIDNKEESLDTNRHIYVKVDSPGIAF